MQTWIRSLRVKNLVMLTAAGIVNAVGVTMFLAPVQLYDSGISGTSMLLGQITPPWLSLSVFLLLLNLPLFFYGLRRQGAVFTAYAIYAVAIYALCAWLITDVLPVDVSIASPIAESDLLLCALFGGAISGIGSGLAIRFGGAMDGIEVMAVIFAKRLGVSVGTFVMAYNMLLYVICGFVMQSWILPLYSIVAYMAAVRTVDFIVDGIDAAKAAMIVTENPEGVSAALMETFGSGATRIEALGTYSGEAKTIVYFVVNRFQTARLRTLVHEADPRAYITITDVADVFRFNQDA